MRIAAVMLVVMFTWSATGCAVTSWWQDKSMRVVQHSRGQPAGLSADEIVVAMRQAGFDDEEIITLGPKLRNSLAESGSARIDTGDSAEAVFKADMEKLYVSSRAKGNFTLPLKVIHVAQDNPSPYRQVNHQQTEQP